MGSLALVWQPVLEKENFELKPVKLHLKIDLVSHHASAEGLVCVCIYIYIYIYIYISSYTHTYKLWVLIIFSLLQKILKLYEGICLWLEPNWWSLEYTDYIPGKALRAPSKKEGYLGYGEASVLKSAVYSFIPFILRFTLTLSGFTCSGHISLKIICIWTIFKKP